MENKIKLLVKVLIGLSFTAPLAIIPSHFIFPFIVPKIVYFRSLVLLMLGGYLILLAVNWSEYKIKSTPTNWAVLVFFLSLAVSTFTGADWYKSFWDNHERMLGLFTLFHYVLYYFIAASVMKEWKEWKWLLRFFLLAGSVVMILGAVQKINPDFLLNQGADRVSATLGNAIYFSAYGLFLFVIGALLFFKEDEKGWRYYAVLGGFLGFLGIFWGGTRGTLLGLVAALGVALIGYFFALKESPRARKAIGAIVIGGICLLGVLFIFRQTEFVRKIPTAGPLLNTSISSGTARTRFMAWEIAVKGWREKPVFGWGPNNYYYAFNKYYNPKFLEHGWGETWFDNAHSAMVNTLATQGLIGLLAYLGLFAVPVLALGLSYKRKKIDSHTACVGSAFLAGHFIHNVFVFENPTSYLYFFFFLAFINQMSEKKADNVAKKKGFSFSFSFGSAIILFLVISLFVYATDIRPAQANTATLKAMQALYRNEPGALEYYNKAAGIPSPHIDDIRNDFARACEQMIPSMIDRGQNQTAKECFEVAYDELQKNRVLHPLDIRVHAAQAQLALYGAQMKQDAYLLYEAEATLQDALNKSPKRQQIQYMLAALKMQLQKLPEAAIILQESVDNDPKIMEGWWRLALVYQQMGNLEMAKKTAQEAIDRGIAFTGQAETVIKNILSQ